MKLLLPKVEFWVRLLLSLGSLAFGLSFNSYDFQTPTRLVTYVPHHNTPIGIPNFVSPQAGCYWSGVGGQIFNRDNRPQAGLIVRITGSLEGRSINLSAVSGSALQFGPGGYEIQLGDHPVSSAALQLRLYNTAGVPQSGAVTVRLYDTCVANLTVINMRQVELTRFQYLPLLSR